MRVLRLVLEQILERRPPLGGNDVLGKAERQRERDDSYGVEGTSSCSSASPGIEIRTENLERNLL